MRFGKLRGRWILGSFQADFFDSGQRFLNCVIYRALAVLSIVGFSNHFDLRLSQLCLFQIMVIFNTFDVDILDFRVIKVRIAPPICVVLFDNFLTFLV